MVGINPANIVIIAFYFHNAMKQKPLESRGKITNVITHPNYRNGLNENNPRMVILGMHASSYQNCGKNEDKNSNG